MSSPGCAVADVRFDDEPANIVMPSRKSARVGFRCWARSIVSALGLRGLLKVFCPCLSLVVLHDTAVPRALQDNEAIRMRSQTRLAIESRGLRIRYYGRAALDKNVLRV